MLGCQHTRKKLEIRREMVLIAMSEILILDLSLLIKDFYQRSQLRRGVHNFTAGTTVSIQVVVPVGVTDLVCIYGTAVVQLLGP